VGSRAHAGRWTADTKYEERFGENLKREKQEKEKNRICGTMMGKNEKENGGEFI
jgi:hypothetical protein